MNERASDAKLHAVLTGDLVGSTRLTAGKLKSAREHFQSAVRTLKSWKRGLVRGDVEFFRGDAWQLLLADPRLALRAAIFLRASVRAFDQAPKASQLDTRMAVGIGTVEQVSPKRISLSTGEAFVISGRALDKLRPHRLTIESDAVAPALAPWLPVISRLCDALISQWSARQAQIVSLALSPERPTQEAIAESLEPPASRQGVGKILNIAHFDAVQSAIDQFETLDWS